MLDTSPSGGGSPFVTTHWSVVLAAKDKTSPASAAALESLCKTYWFPLYAFVRRTGRSPEDAQDLTQEFFRRLLQKDYLQSADREKGRFRTFLRVALKHFLSNEMDRTKRIKRGGSLHHVPFDTQLAEQCYSLENNSDTLSPDKLYERRWAMTLLNSAMDRLQEEYSRANKSVEFDTLKRHLTADRGTIPYAEIAAQLRMSEGNARISVHRMRKQFRRVFRAEVAETVGALEDLDEELRHIATVLSQA